MSEHQGMLFGDNSLAVARRRVMEKLDEGSHCPCCDQLARRYARKLNSGMARTLGWLVRHSGRDREWVDVHGTAPRWVVGSNEVSRLALWDLVESKPSEDGERRASGIWRPTPLGWQFVIGAGTVPRIAYVYRAQADGFSQEQTTWPQALGDRFSVEELLGRDLMAERLTP